MFLSVNNNTLPTLFYEARKKPLFLAVIACIALSIFYIYRLFLNKQPLSDLRASKVSHWNKKAIEEGKDLMKVLLSGSSENLARVAKKSAEELGVPFHSFDGRENKAKEIHSLLRRISSGKGTECVFVSHVDQLQRSMLDTILVHTGSSSKQLLLYLGAPSKASIDPALASRCQLTIPVSDSCSLV